MEKYYLCFRVRSTGKIERSAYNTDNERDGFDSLTALLFFIRHSGEGVIIQSSFDYIIEKVSSEYME